MPKEPAPAPVNGATGDHTPSVPGTLPDDLYDYYTTEPKPRRSPQTCNDPTSWRVVDDWPERVPLTEVEIEVFERWFGDIFDELFGPNPPQENLTELSHSDNNSR
ncbi:MAG: hypothetical protein KKG69_01845 [Alphaproteobacteria bacterium]|nr:hypothetical protein [Alphaproteobacteria bacterium]MBU2230002.1 hypothetical protein [Alphaproteobacteria bacterium]